MALAISARSPKSWLISFRYGRLAAAGAGARELEERLEQLRALDRRRSRPRRGRAPGCARKKSQFGPLALEVLGFGSMLIALCLATSLLTAGQTSTQMPQPVQSSGRPGRSAAGPGAPCRATAATGSRRGAPCEQRRLVDLDPDGRVRADQGAEAALDADVRVPDRDLVRDAPLLVRAVPVGKVPSTGSALTGSRSPSPSIIIARDPLDEVGRVGGDRRRRRRAPSATRRDRRPRAARASAPSTAAKFCSSDGLAALAVGLLDRVA